MKYNIKLRPNRYSYRVMSPYELNPDSLTTLDLIGYGKGIRVVIGMYFSVPLPEFATVQRVDFSRDKVLGIWPRWTLRRISQWLDRHPDLDALLKSPTMEIMIRARYASSIIERALHACVIASMNHTE